MGFFKYQIYPASMAVRAAGCSVMCSLNALNTFSARAWKLGRSRSEANRSRFMLETELQLGSAPSWSEIGRERRKQRQGWREGERWRETESDRK